MNKVDTGVVDSVAPGRLMQQAGVREDSWQHALERAFLAQGGGRFAAAGQDQSGAGKQPMPPPKPSDDIAHFAQSAKGMAAHLSALKVYDTAAVQPVSAALGAVLGSSDAVAYRASAPQRVDTANDAETPQLDESAPQVRLAWGAYARSAPGATAEGPASAADQAAPVTSNEAGREVPAQHVFLERTRHGAVIWIRDAQASPAQLRTLVNALLQQSKTSGVPVCGVRINGVPVDVDSPSDGSTPLDPEAVAPSGPPALSRRHTHGH